MVKVIIEQRHLDEVAYRVPGRNIGTCYVEGCNKPAKTRELCSAHYHRFQRYGDPLGTPQPKQKMPKKLCSVDKCSRYMISRGLCPAHYRRWKVHGDVLANIPIIDGTQKLVRKRYRRITCPGHPLANAEGRVPQHRYVLYEALGPGLHNCNWCEKKIKWDGERWNDYIVVDHLNFNRSDNRLENLVPSCDRCNSHRWEVMQSDSQ